MLAALVPLPPELADYPEAVAMADHARTIMWIFIAGFVFLHLAVVGIGSRVAREILLILTVIGLAFMVMVPGDMLDPSGILLAIIQVAGLACYYAPSATAWMKVEAQSQ
jgi:hypothetical protein